MFSESSITSFDSDLPEMVDGSNMFEECYKLQTVNINAPKMKYSDTILANCTGLTSATINAPEMISGNNMLFGSTSLTTVELNAPKLMNGYCAFYGCTNLTTFSGDLSSLKEGYDMFYKCKLDGASVANIYNTIPDITVPHSTYALDYVGKLSVGIGSSYSSTASTNKSRLNTFAVAAGFADWASLKQAFVDKGWNVTWYYSASDKIIEV